MAVTLPHNITPTDPREIEPIMANFNTLADKFSGNIGSADITDSAITTQKVANLAVTTAKIANENVTTAKIANGNVTTEKMVDASITTAKIADANVTTAKIADDAVTLAKLGTDLYAFNHDVSSGATASVVANLSTFANIGSTIYTVTPTANCYLMVSGYVTLTHSAASSSTPTLRVALRDTTANANLIAGGLQARIGSDTAPVCLPVGGLVPLTAGQTYTVSLAVSSSVSGTVTLSTSSKVSAILIPR